ncbi:uncharacterized protein LOC113779219 [Coffea eugenioides]|uniref:uncharacterized protein LOC113779219 n=1 Tax=Coffea eugenioides TaxID=49369 RepID=UPI000F60510B|nr:uncharacterized protein LOC113779219 [Coffea eugenioides]
MIMLGKVDMQDTGLLLHYCASSNVNKKLILRILEYSFITAGVANVFAIYLQSTFDSGQVSSCVTDTCRINEPNDGECKSRTLQTRSHVAKSLGYKDGKTGKLLLESS